VLVHALLLVRVQLQAALRLQRLINAVQLAVHPLQAVLLAPPLSHAHVDEVAAGDPCHARVGLEHLLRVEILGDGVLPEVRVGHVGVRVVVGVRHGLVLV